MRKNKRKRKTTQHNNKIHDDTNKTKDNTISITDKPQSKINLQSN